MKEGRQAKINIGKDVQKLESSCIVGRKAGRAAMEDSLVVPQNIKYGIII